MKNCRRSPRGVRRHRGVLFLAISVLLAFASYIEQVVSYPAYAADYWPIYPRRNIGALARSGYLRSALAENKRSISTLAKNGQLPTYKAPYDRTDKQDSDNEESYEKRNMASIARLRSYAAIKRNVQALARDGYKPGRNSQQANKRFLFPIDQNALNQKTNEMRSTEYYYPFYQNPIPPLSELDRPYDFNELYDYQQSVNPDMFPPLSQAYKRNGYFSEVEFVDDEKNASEVKKSVAGLPALGMIRPSFLEATDTNKRQISLFDHDNMANHNPDDFIEDKRSVDLDEDEVRNTFEKRHIGSLARLGLLPSFRFSGGRYSRSGRARLMLPSQEMYRKHSADENFGIREYSSSAEVEPAIDPDDSNLPPPAVLAHSHPTGRILNRLLNDLPNSSPTPTISSSEYINALHKNSWLPKEIPKFYHFRSLKVPYHSSGKRYLLLPAVDNILLRKNYPNSSLPARRKNQ